MADKLIELEEFCAPPHAKHIIAKKEGDTLKIHLLDRFYNNQGHIVLSVENTKVLIKELMDELYGEVGKEI